MTLFQTQPAKLSNSGAHAYARAHERCRASKGAQGVDGQTFDDAQGYGVQKWLGELVQMLGKEHYEPQAIRMVFILKPHGKLWPPGI